MNYILVFALNLYALHVLDCVSVWKAKLWKNRYSHISTNCDITHDWQVYILCIKKNRCFPYGTTKHILFLEFFTKWLWLCIDYKSKRNISFDWIALFMIKIQTLISCFKRDNILSYLIHSQSTINIVHKKMYCYLPYKIIYIHLFVSQITFCLSDF